MEAPGPSLASPPLCTEMGNGRLSGWVLEGQVSGGRPHHTGPGPAYQSHSGWASGASGWKAEDSESRPRAMGEGEAGLGAAAGGKQGHIPTGK